MLTPTQARVRSAVYEHLIRTGDAPDAETLADATALDPPGVVEILHELEDAHVLALQPDRESIWMAHPFSAVPTPYPVETIDGARYWANCAWDVLGILSLIGRDGRSDTSCPDCAEALVLEVTAGTVVDTGDVIHFLVPPPQFWEDVGFT